MLGRRASLINRTSPILMYCMKISTRPRQRVCGSKLTETPEVELVLGLGRGCVWIQTDRDTRG